MYAGIAIAIPEDYQLFPQIEVEDWSSPQRWDAPESYGSTVRYLDPEALILVVETVEIQPHDWYDAAYGPAHLLPAYDHTSIVAYQLHKEA